MRKLLLILLCCFIGGCASYKQLQLNYKLDAPKEKIYQNEHHQKIAVTVDDKRDPIDNRLILQNSGPYQNTSVEGGYIAEEPISSILKKGFYDGFKQMNYNVVGVNSSRYEFVCDINDVNYKNVSNLFIKDLIVEINVTNYLFDNKLGRVIWEENLTGRGKINNFFGSGNSTNEIKNAFCLAITDLIRKTQRSRIFRLSN
jgi:hypothetical protein